jgi:endonuclease YncB( thermonuclease family)
MTHRFERSDYFRVVRFSGFSLLRLRCFTLQASISDSRISFAATTRFRHKFASALAFLPATLCATTEWPGATETTMNVRNTLLLLMLLGAAGASGRPASNPVSGMTLIGIYASKPGDTTVYCVLGASACLVPRDAGTADHFIAQWLISHSTATVISVSSETQTIPNSTMPATPAKLREVFVWIADGDDTLNVALVREGYYAGKSMIDMVENEQQQIERAKKITAEHPSGGFADVMAKWRESVPTEDRPRRLISDSDYALRMKQITAAEHDAQLAKRGIWSDDAHRKASAISQKSRESFSIRDLYVHGVNAHRRGDSDIYCLIGGDFCLTMLGPMTHEKQVTFISNWLSLHPTAIAIPISTESRKVMRDLPPVHGTYIWIEDGMESLNLALVREGYYGARALIDMVDARQQFDNSMNTPAMSATKAILAKEQAEEDAPQRLVTNQDYKSKMDQANAAEQDATKAQVGIWSPSEIVHWKPPSDASMIDVYSKHPDWFQQVSALAREDERLTKVIRSPASIAEARSNGVGQANLDAYVALLEKLGVNETIANVLGLGQLSLVKADIIVGLFDNGIIKGYVYSPLNPQPIVEDLEDWPPELLNVNTAYRSIGNGWYLFELRH